jgi:hypothetical protein
MVQERLGAESLKGLLTHAVIARLRTDERRQELIDTLRRRGLAVTLNWNRERGVRAKSRIRLLPQALGGENPREHPVGDLLNTCRLRGTLGRVKAQEPRLAEPARSRLVGIGYTGE